MQSEISTKHGDSKESSNSLNVSIILLKSYTVKLFVNSEMSTQHCDKS